MQIAPYILQRRVEAQHGRELRIGTDELLEKVLGVKDPFMGPKVLYVKYSARGRVGRTKIQTEDKLIQPLVIAAPNIKGGRQGACKSLLL